MFLVYMILALATAMILSVLLMRAAMLVAVRRAGAHIEENFGLIEHITDTRTVPPSWQGPFVEKIVRLQRRNPDNQSKQTRILQAAQRACLKQLTQLIRYTQNSPFIRDTDTRERLLTELKAVYGEWKVLDWEGMVGSKQ